MAWIVENRLGEACILSRCAAAAQVFVLDPAEAGFRESLHGSALLGLGSAMAVTIRSTGGYDGMPDLLQQSLALAAMHANSEKRAIT